MRNTVSFGWLRRIYVQQLCADTGCSLEYQLRAMMIGTDLSIYLYISIYIYIYIYIYSIIKWRLKLGYAVIINLFRRRILLVYSPSRRMTFYMLLSLYIYIERDRGRERESHGNNVTWWLWYIYIYIYTYIYTYIYICNWINNLTS